MHPRRGAGIELLASLRHRLRQGRHRGIDAEMTPFPNKEIEIQKCYRVCKSNLFTFVVNSSNEIFFH